MAWLTRLLPRQLRSIALSKRMARRLGVEELEFRWVPTGPTLTGSSNWSGYIVTTNAGGVTAVSGSWIVPTVTGAPGANTASSTWIGIDGGNVDDQNASSSVEQIGTEQDIQNGVPTYFAWWEMYPTQSIQIPSSSITIHPGDVITASVVANTQTGDFTLTITDGTQSFSTTQAPPPVIFNNAGIQIPAPTLSSAEWIVEAPTIGNSQATLANFGSVSFANSQTTIDNETGAITNTGSAAWTSAAAAAFQVDMIDINSNATIANASTLTADGMGFTVNYGAAGSITTATTLTDNGISAATAGGSIELGNTLTFTITVTPASGPAATGTVQIEDASNGNLFVGSAQTLVNGSATVSVAATAANNLGAGDHELFAVFTPSGNFASSLSDQVDQKIDSVFKVQTLGGSATSNLVQTATGFKVTFNSAVNTSDLSIYGSGQPSLTFMNGSTEVPGSLVFDSTNTQATFVATGSFATAATPLAGLLTAGAGYTVDLSGTNDNAFRDLNGNVLGSSSGTRGSDFTTSFTSNNSATAATISVPYFARGYSQAVNILADTTNGLPVSINVPAGGAPVTSVSFDLFYDPTLLTVTGGNITAPSPFTGSVTVVAPGHIQVSLSGGATGSLAAGTLTDIVSLTASVPSTAPYRNKEILDIRKISINGGTNNGQDGSAVHAATFLDATQGPAIPSNYSAQDAFNILKASVGLPGALYNTLLDPTILADDSGAGRTTSQQAFDVSKKAAGLSSPLIPDLPTGTPPAVGGPDPYLYIDPSTTAVIGSTTTVHVNLQSLEAAGFDFQSTDIAISFDPSKIQISNVRAGSYSAISGFGASLQISSNLDNNAGTLFIAEITNIVPNGVTIPNGVTGDLVDFDITFKNGVVPSTSVIKLAANIGIHFTDVNGGAATLTPPPDNTAYNAKTDDQVNIVNPSATLAFPASSSGGSGRQITVPINLTGGAGGFTYNSDNLAISFDPTKLSVASVAAGSYAAIAGFGASLQVTPNINNTTGTLLISEITTNTSGVFIPAGTTGDIVDVTFNVLSNDLPGTTVIKLNASIGSNTPTEVNGGAVVLSPAPDNSAYNSATDDLFSIVLVPNQPPYNNVPTAAAMATKLGGGVLFNPASGAGLQTATASTVVFSTANGDAIKVSDRDYIASGPAETTTVTVIGTPGGRSTGAVGTLTATASGSAVVSGNGTASLTITGSPTDITATLNGLTYTPGAGFFGTTTLTVSTNDNGNVGFGGPMVDTRTTSINVVGLYISEVNLNKVNTTNPSQYIEVFSTVPDYTIPTGFYLVGINGAASTVAQGLVTDIFNLGGFTTGDNGYLDLMEKSNLYHPVGGASLSNVSNSGSGAGFGNGATSKFNSTTGVHIGGSRQSGQLVTDIATGAESFLLIQSATAPTTSVNIDPGNTGNPANQTSAYNSWNVLDSVGVLDATSTSHSYAAVTFEPTTGSGTTLSGSTLIASGTWVANYVGRIAQNVGSTGSDWLASQPAGTPAAGFTLGTNSTKFVGSPLDSVGGPNGWAPEETVAVNDGGSVQHSQVTELTVTFNTPVSIAHLQTDFVVKDASGNVLTTVVTVTAGNDNGDGTASIVTQLVITFNTDTSADTYALSGADPFGNTRALVDGNYFLNTIVADITANGVALDGAHNGVGGSTTTGTGNLNGNGVNEVDEFWRLFGDVTGHRVVNGVDNSTMRTAYNTTSASPNYLWYLDFNMDGSIDSTDLMAYRKNLGRRITQ